MTAHPQADRAGHEPSLKSRPFGDHPLREAAARWDRAWLALMRRDYAEYDRITGFKMPEGDTQ